MGNKQVIDYSTVKHNKETAPSHPSKTAPRDDYEYLVFGS